MSSNPTKPKGRRPACSSPTTTRRVLSKTRELKAVEMRLQGYRYHDIAQKLGVTEVAVYYMIKRTLEHWNEDLKEKVPQLRQMELARLESYIKSLQKKIHYGDVKAIQAAVRVHERIARIMGLDAPTSIKHSGEGEGGAISVEVFRQMITEAQTETVNAIEEGDAK